MAMADDLIEEVQRIYVLLDDGTRRALLPSGLSPAQFGLLKLLETAPPQGMSVTALANQMLCTRGNTSRLVARMVDADLVETGPAPGDERLVLVRLAPKGSRALERAHRDLADCDSGRFAGISPAQGEVLLAGLRNLGDGLAERLTMR